MFSLGDCFIKLFYASNKFPSSKSSYFYLFVKHVFTLVLNNVWFRHVHQVPLRLASCVTLSERGFERQSPQRLPPTAPVGRMDRVLQNAISVSEKCTKVANPNTTPGRSQIRSVAIKCVAVSSSSAELTT